MKYTILLLSLCIILACQSAEKKMDGPGTQKSNFTFATWTHAGSTFDKKEWEKRFDYYDSIGITEALVGGNPEVLSQIVPLANDKNIKIHAWMWTLNRPNYQHFGSAGLVL